MTAALADEAAGAQDILPIVGEDRGNRPLWIGLGAIGIMGLLLFWQLDSSRRAASAPEVRAKVAANGNLGNNLPELYVPPEYAPPPAPYIPFTPVTPTVPAPPVKLQTIAPVPPVQPDTHKAQKAPAPIIIQPNPVVQNPAQALTSPPTTPDPSRNSPMIIYEAGAAPAAAGTASAGAAGGISAGNYAPIRAMRSTNRSALVAQGTLIAAVLETAIDSTHPGQARAMVSSNIFDSHGTQLLIPRGSRLYGEYKGDVSAGQSRAYILWTRLVRPDGVTIALDSPASDRLGRTGVKGKVNNHFFERLGNALLQSAIDIGSMAAARGISGDAVVVAVPGATRGAASQIMPESPKPTLTVKQGTKISVFVARDLDFSGVEQGQ